MAEFWNTFAKANAKPAENARIPNATTRPAPTSVNAIVDILVETNAPYVINVQTKIVRVLLA